MTKTFLNVYNKSKTKVAVLQNAYDIEETQELNKIYSLSFSMPLTDPKNEYCQPFYFVRYGDYGQLYRIIEVKNSENDVGTITYQCEHVITTLVDKILKNDDGTFYLTLGGSKMKTRAVINKLLSYSDDWELDRCDFTYEYEYGWEQENLLNALYSIPEVFTDKYRWSFDTSTTKWKISLIKIDESINPEYYIRAKMNLLSSESSQVNTDICTRLYPLGYGEGVNQLTIKEVNKGKTYLDAPQEVINKYGTIEKIVVDRSYESAESLKAYGEKMLKELQSPTYTRTFDVVDLYPITNEEIQNAEVGKICRMTMDMSTAYITKTVRKLDVPGDLQIELSNKTENVADALASLADRVRIESTYSQGATQIYQHSKDGNADTANGLVMNLYFPSDMRQINKILMKVELESFRAYSNTSSSGGGSTGNADDSNKVYSVKVAGGDVDGEETLEKDVSLNFTGAGGVTSAPIPPDPYTHEYVETSEPDVDTTSGAIWADMTNPINTQNTKLSIESESYNSTLSIGNLPFEVVTGNPDFQGTTYPDNHVHNISNHSHNVSGSHNHSIFNESTREVTGEHKHNILWSEIDHTHNINHFHKVDVSGVGTGGYHTHTFNIPVHSHTLTPHTHDIIPGIYKFGNPSGFTFFVNGKQHGDFIPGINWDGDITSWLIQSGKIPRNQWIKLEIRPNDLAYIICSVFIQGFIQSRGGGNY